jgi:hypothetical protein
VRLPGAEGSQAAETAPVQPWSDDEAMMLDAPPVAPPDRTPAGLLAMLREMLPQCVAVAWEQNIIVGELLETIVTYRLDPEAAKSSRNPLGVDLDRIEKGWPSSVTLHDTWPTEDTSVLGEYRREFAIPKSTREIVITWR